MVDAVSAVVIGYYVAAALATAVRGRGSDAARLKIAEGVLAALGFSVAGSLLKIIALQTWPQIRLFAFVFVLRTLLKRVFGWGREADCGPRGQSSRRMTFVSTGSDEAVARFPFSCCGGGP